MRSLAELVRVHRQRRSLSQAAFARAVGIRAPRLSELLAGRRRLSRQQLAAARRWCDALDLDGAEADELIDAMYVSAAEPRVREIIARLAAAADRGALAELKLEAKNVFLRRLAEDDTPRPR